MIERQFIAVDDLVANLLHRFAGEHVRDGMIHRLSTSSVHKSSLFKFRSTADGTHDRTRAATRART